MRKKFFSLLMCVCMTAVSVIPASAGGQTGDRSSHVGTANVWNQEDTLSITYSTGYAAYPAITGGLVGLEFVYVSVGMPNDFVKTNNRWAFYEVYEDDLIFPDVFARSYQASFTTYSGGTGGLYRPVTTPTLTNYTLTKIEDDGTVELYMKYFITTDPGDTGTTIPAGLLRYHFTSI